MSEPLLVEILAYAPTAYYQCRQCEVAWRATGVANPAHKEQLQSSLPPDLVQDYQAVSDWVRELFRVHRDRVVIKVIDAASPEGFVKALRYRAGRFPAVIVGRETRFVGRSVQVLEAARQEVDRRLGAPEAIQT